VIEISGQNRAPGISKIGEQGSIIKKVVLLKGFFKKEVDEKNVLKNFL